MKGNIPGVLLGIYQSYRLDGLFLLVIIVFILYTSFIPVNILFYSGFYLDSVYLMGIRLFMIFINRMFQYSI